MAVFAPELTSVFKEGLRLVNAGEVDRAAQRFADVIARAPNYPAALGNLALCHFKRGDYSAAEETYRRALAIFSDDIGLMQGLATSVHEAGRLEEACGLYQKVLAKDPKHVSALHNLANALRDLGQFNAAIDSYCKALALKPDHHQCRLGYASALFYRGDWKEAWRMFEARLDVAQIVPPMAFTSSSGDRGQPLHWTGGPQPHSLLVIAEQGRGDTIQFVRYLPQLAQRGRIALLADREMFALLRTLDAPLELVSRKDGKVEGISGWIPLLSVPMAIGLKREQFTPKTPYLAADPALVARWAKRIGGDELKVGIAWQGNPQGAVDRGRSLPLAAFAPLAAIPGVRLISLQKGFGAEQCAGVPFSDRIETLGPEFDAGEDAFIDSAAVMMALDLVVASDSAIAHLAGALGRPVWVLLKTAPNWRWLFSGEDSPFYPTARLFRQSAPGDWVGVLGRVAAEVVRLARETRAGAV